MMRLLRAALILLPIGLAAFWWISRPESVSAAALAGLEGDPVRGREVFFAAGCAGCHAAPNAVGEDFLKLAGGRQFPSDFGTFVAPNISPDPEFGIGRWTDAQLVTAIMNGVSPKGEHYYPAFPYGTYAKAEPSDILSLIAFMRTLPPVATPSQPHKVSFPFNIRRSLGIWKVLFQGNGWVINAPKTDEEFKGRYLVEALGHCAECHTPRNALGGLEIKNWMTGAPIPGKASGKTPGITPAQLDWSAADIAEYLKSGFTPTFDTAGGEMVTVIESTSMLTDNDRRAIALYIKGLPTP